MFLLKQEGKIKEELGKKGGRALGVGGRRREGEKEEHG